MKEEGISPKLAEINKESSCILCLADSKSYMRGGSQNLGHEKDTKTWDRLMLAQRCLGSMIYFRLKTNSQWMLPLGIFISLLFLKTPDIKETILCISLLLDFTQHDLQISHSRKFHCFLKLSSIILCRCALGSLFSHIYGLGHGLFPNFVYCE